MKRRKNHKVLRPEVELEFQRPILGRLLFPFYCVWIYLRCVRVVRINYELNNQVIGSYRVLIVPKVTGVDAVGK